MNVTEQIIDIRERVTRIEAIMENLQEVVEHMGPSRPQGSVVIPVAVATAIIQAVVALAQHFF